MPRRTDIHRILVIGSGPIVIGQAAEFDYSGTQATKALREEGYEVILINSNPATIMTDPEIADRTYVEPVTAEFVELIIDRERPDALLPTMGGQTALNVAMTLAENGVLEKYGVELIGASARSIAIAEDRKQFGEAMERIGLDCATGGIATTFDEAVELLAVTGFPAIVRPSFTLGGTGGGIAYNREEFEETVRRGLDLSPTSQILIERSLIGWKEFELEVMRDQFDNVVIVCSIENLDPMGVHTGDSITVAPAMTLTDREYQTMRDAAVAIIREVGVDAGGCNIQFAINPADGEMVVIEMNPRVSRSSALASKATGFPIARIGAKLAVGYRLDEIPNDITKTTPASFEPVLDYVVVKVPRFAFEKFPSASPLLTTQMKSVGESMSIGRTFKEAFQKALRALENGRSGWEIGKRLLDDRLGDETIETLRGALRQPTPERIYQVKRGFLAGMAVEELFELTAIDPWFLSQMEELIEAEREYAALAMIDEAAMRRSVQHHLEIVAAVRARDPDWAQSVMHSHLLSARASQGAASVQDGGHLRRRVSVGHTVPVRQLRRGKRGTAQWPHVGGHPWQWAEPDRAGGRVRLLLRACRDGAPRAGVRDDHDQLEPRNRLDGFRYVGQALLRAAHARGCAGDCRARAAHGRDRAAGWTDAAEADARPRGGRRPHPRHVARLD